MLSSTRIPFKILLMVSFGSFMIYGCVSNQSATLLVPIDTTPTVITVSQIPLSTLTFENTTQRPIKTPPSAPSNFPPTWTPLPTYPPNESRQIVMDLYENNPCKLPCWWGITPGKTDWRDAWQFLGRFAINKAPWDNLLLESKSLPGYMFFQVLLDVPQTQDDKIYYYSLNHLVFVINIDTFDVDYIDVNTGNIEAYTIPKILSTYGEPQGIYVQIGGGQVSQYSGVSLLLYYPKYGFISNHFAIVDQKKWNEPKFTACFQKVTNLYMWPQNQNLEFNARLRISDFDPLGISLIKTIDQVSDFNAEMFYKNYSNLQEEPCIEFKSPGQP